MMRRTVNGMTILHATLLIAPQRSPASPNFSKLDRRHLLIVGPKIRSSTQPASGPLVATIPSPNCWPKKVSEVFSGRSLRKLVLKKSIVNGLEGAR